MSALEIVGLFTVILATGVSIAGGMISAATGFYTIYRWARRGKQEHEREQAEADRALLTHPKWEHR